MTRIQRAVRFEDETWDDLRAAAKSVGVSTTALVEALSAEWVSAIEMAEPWAIKALSEAKSRHKTLQNSGWRQKTAENGK